jgi:hypothetical protein
MIEECLEFKKTILIYYGRHKIMTLQQWVPKTQVWAITEAITYCLNIVVNACVMNQSRGCWLLSDALTTITRNLVIHTNPHIFYLCTNQPLFHILMWLSSMTPW